MARYLTRRAGLWHYARRVPDVVAHLDPRGIVKQSTRIRIADDPRGVKAGRAADQINEQLEAYWKALLDGQATEAQARYDAARRRARAFGFEYRVAGDLTEAALRDLLERARTIRESSPATEELTTIAVLGGEDPPALRLSTLFEEFERLNLAANKDLSPDQKRKWRNPKLRAIANFVDVIGDMPLIEVTRSHALTFRTWWQDRILEEDLEIGTANKDLGHLNVMFKAVDRIHHLGLQPVFAELRIAGERTGQRTAFAPAFVQDQLLAEGALDGLNPEARAIVYLIVETGLRLSEAANLTAETIRLDGDIPHVMVRPDGRRMKTDQSGRDIPLVGVSLMAAQAHPAGFPRYRDKAASLSAIVNKVLSGRGLLPTPNHSLYSLRHTFEDRLTKVEAPDKLAAAMMGHKFHRPRYGVGPSLEQKHGWLQRIAFRSPTRV